MFHARLGVKSRERVELIEITDEVQDRIRQSGIREGICLVSVPHTTAGVTVNENADPSVVQDMVMELNKIVPFQDGYTHAEGNSAAHIKSSLVGCSVQLPISGGRLLLGTWQGIWFCEFDGPRSRSVDVQIVGAGGL
jgi:secondary thiamine-phosphate synthase enzyme